MKEANQYNYCHIAEHTDVGCKRKVNEDWMAHFESPNGLVSVVCDGMGGHVGGQIASHVAVDAIRDFLMGPYIDSPTEAIVQAINYANNAILQRTAQQPELTGMGSTCILLIVRDGKVYIGSVGDSRVYLVRNRIIKQLTKDQSYVQMLVDNGEITAEQAEHHPRKNEILNALGLPTMQPATVLPDPILPEAGDCFVLCSDGLSGMVSDHEIQKVVSSQVEMSQQARVDKLIEMARANGGLDNITCQIVEFSVTPEGNRTAINSKSRKFLPYILSAAAALLVIIGGICLWKNDVKDDNGQKNAVTHEDEFSKEMKELMANADSVVQLGSVVYVKGQPIVNLKENAEFGGLSLKIIADAKTGKETSLGFREPLKISGMEIFPNNCIDKITTGNDQTECTLKFNDADWPQKEKNIALQFLLDKRKYVFIISVTVPNIEKYDDHQQSLKKTKGGTVLKDIPFMGSNNDSDEAEKLNPIDKQVTAGEKNFEFKVIAGEGTNTENRIYIGRNDIALKSGTGDNGWYTWSCDGREFTAIVRNADTGEQAIPVNAQVKVCDQDGHEVACIRVKKK